MPDLDNTSVTFYLLNNHGHNLDTQIFNNFRKGKRIFCFPKELDSSPTHLFNYLYALESLNSLEVKDHIKDIIQSINRLFSKNGITDKWHISPFYLIALGIVPLLKYENELGMKLLELIINSQNQDGGWGTPTSNLEETCWAIFALFQANNVTKNNDIISKAHVYLKKQFNKPLFINLWIDKVLYSPINIVKALYFTILLKLEIMNDNT